MGDLTTNFDTTEFPQGEVLHASPLVFKALQGLRGEAGPIAPSKVKGALARFDGGTSQHSTKNGPSKAVDFFPENPIQAFLKSFKYFNGIGIYLDTRNNNGDQAIMIHGDLRTSPVWWIRIAGEYIYPKTEKARLAALEAVYSYEIQKRL